MRSHRAVTTSDGCIGSSCPAGLTISRPRAARPGAALIRDAGFVRIVAGLSAGLTWPREPAASAAGDDSHDGGPDGVWTSLGGQPGGRCHDGGGGVPGSERPCGPAHRAPGGRPGERHGRSARGGDQGRPGRLSVRRAQACRSYDPHAHGRRALDADQPPRLPRGCPRAVTDLPRFVEPSVPGRVGDQVQRHAPGRQLPARAGRPHRGGLAVVQDRAGEPVVRQAARERAVVLPERARRPRLHPQRAAAACVGSRPGCGSTRPAAGSTPATT
jgi:hypothetical protein